MIVPRIFSSVCIAVAILVLLSVMGSPVMAAEQIESHTAKTREKYAAELQELTKDGQPVNLTKFSNLSVFRDSRISGIDVTISTPGGGSEEYSEGLFTVRTVPLPSGTGSGTGQSGLVAGNFSSNAGYTKDADAMCAIANLTKVGYIYSNSSIRTSVNKIVVTDRMSLTPSEMAKAGLSWSPTDPHTLISQSTISDYIFTDPETSTSIDVNVIEQTTSSKDPIGGKVVTVAPLTPHAGNSRRYLAFKETMGPGNLGVGAGAGALTTGGILVYVYFSAGTAVTATKGVAIGEATHLLIAGVGATYGSTAAATGGAATGAAAGAASGITVGTIAAACLAGLIVAIVVLAIIFLLIYIFTRETLAYFMIVPDPTTKSVVSNSDGVIVYDDGSYQFMVDPVPPPLPDTGSRWVSATRTAAINQNGELWVLDGSQWTKHSSDNTYTSVKASGSWFATVATDPTGKSILEIPDGGKAQPTKDSSIRKDLDLLNSGKDPRKSNEVIYPAVTGWKEFVPGVDSSRYGPYGLALATDGRVFGVGSNRDGQLDLEDRYDRVTTSYSDGWFSTSPYSLGIRSDTGAIDFAGDDSYNIKADIKSAGLTNVNDFAAGPDRAIAITKDGGVQVFGANDDWDHLYAGPVSTESGTYTAISATLPTDNPNVCTFVATQLNENSLPGPLLPLGNVIAFGNTGKISGVLIQNDFSRLGGESAIRRTGEIETFLGHPPLPGTDWVQSTYGAGITENGTLVTWTPGTSVITNTYPATPDKQYVAVSRFIDGDWLLAITKDSAGETRLELVIEGDLATHPEIRDQLPTGTGWTKIAAGNNQGLALKPDGSLVAWGKNEYGQLDLPTDKKYVEIDAGRDFSLGLVEFGNRTGTTGPDLMVVANGTNLYGQVSDMNALPPGKYITIKAGTVQSAAIDAEGMIKWGGRRWSGAVLPEGNGYTDIEFGEDIGFVLKEPSDEVILDKPIILGKPLDGRKRSGSTDTPTIPFGSTIERTVHDIIRIYGPDGTQLSWINGKEAREYNTSTGRLQMSQILVIPSDSLVIPLQNDGGSVTVLNPASNETILNTIDWNIHSPENSSTPMGVCTPAGCSAAIYSNQDRFLSVPVSATGSPGSVMPVLSASQTSDGLGVVTMSEQSPGYSGATTSLMGTTIPAGSPLTLTIANTSPGESLSLTEISELVDQNSGLQYTITGTSSAPVSSMIITPQIWKKTETGDVLVDTGAPVTCSAVSNCVATGNFIPADAGTYYANATTVYTLPVMTVNRVAAETRGYTIATVSEERAYPLSCRGPPSDDYFDFVINRVKLEGHTDWQDAVCYDNAMIRWAKAGKSSSLKSNLTPNLWKENKDCPTDYSFAVDSPANKPIYLGAVYNNAVENPKVWSHSVDAELLDTSVKPEDTKWANWKFFQYDNLDITGGDWNTKGDYQIPWGGASAKTRVQIKSYKGIVNGYWTTETIHTTFYIDSRGGVSKDPNPPYMSGYLNNPTKKILIKNDAVPTDLQTIIGSVGRNDLFSLNKWEWNSASNEITFYVFDILDEGPIHEIQNKKIGNYSVNIIHDTEFEETRNSTGQKLMNYLKDPGYQIAHIAMSTNRISDPPENSAELWVYRSTPENMKLDNTVINGWTIHVYPASG